MAEKGFSFKDLWPIGILLICVGVEMIFFPESIVQTLSLFAFAYVQNIAFSLASRARNRSSSAYHFIAMSLSTLIFFWMLERLFTNQLSLFLFVPYVAGTVAGSITGSQISIWIEAKINAVADIATGTPLTKRGSLEQGWPIAVCVAALLVECIIFPSRMGMYIVLAALLFTDSFSHTLSSRAGNRNKPNFILATTLFKGCVGFLIYQKLVAYSMDWSLWIPYATGSISGSIAGALVSMKIEKKIEASADTHLKEKKQPALFFWPIVILLCIVGVTVMVIPSADVSVMMTLCGLAMLQNFSFLVVSRARNRNNILYHAIASIFSNGIWFLTLRELYITGLSLPFMIPFAIGTTVGSLIAYNVSIRIERKIGAVADSHTVLKPKSV